MNPLGYCQLTKRSGAPCQQPLCARNGRLECIDGHPQPDHPWQKELDQVAAQRKNEPPPAAPDPASYVPESTWVVNARQTAALAERVAKLEARVASLEGKQTEGRSRKVG